ncbi:MAG: glycine--tRNA ligase subunit beta [Rhodanobacteraceae bacterium]|nr:glycine--tRNA ligase subunit beta [Rhodanobacteraceae bacterium]MBK7042901.1 glycine--tRNA ligase subunit beta [Rhodanobacteraceae bacterium]MBP9153709.1 glycine--tRNA ligase subunit beta [Xanthomonadales bacterium]HQW81100.1 glycine--tRNA ligase subunit beta [Pseudomonadota bacterium]
MTLHIAPLLIELGTEELPPKALDELANAFRDGVLAGLAKRGIAHTAHSARALHSPRRLATWIEDVALQQPEQKLERRGPAVAAALDASGAPSKALIGFAHSCGVSVEQLEEIDTDKGAWFVHRAIKPGEATASLLPQIVEEALKALPIPKPMRWSDLDYQFVRPAHWLVILLGEHIVDAEILGLKSDRMSRGHRFHHPEPVWITSANDYVDALRSAKVLVNPAERANRVISEVQRVAEGLGGLPRLRQELVDEVKNLVEWPVAIACTFERDFLRVPQEALIMTMESNQKFFPVFDADGRLTEHFIGVANIESRDPNEIRKGYERVIRPRFADAKFFFDEDLKSPLAAQQDALQKVTYQQKLGSVWDKVCRVGELARVIAERLRSMHGIGVDPAQATQAATLAKCDLMTRMVGEFPELQGIMGRYYATMQGESAEVANAIDEFYQPRFAGDAIAPSRLGQVLAVAEKLDTLAGMFAIGQKPTGNKDPFSLRRNALGLARTLIEGGLDLDVNALLREAIAAISTDALDAKANDLYDFITDRLRGYYADQGIRGDAFEAVLAVRPASLRDFDRRICAIDMFGKRAEAESLAAANKRIGNILRQASEKRFAIAAGIDAALLDDGAERALADALAAAIDDISPLLAEHRYVETMQRLAQLRPVADAFFDGVMVMVDDPAKRANRLALLRSLRTQFLAIADIGLLG